MSPGVAGGGSIWARKEVRVAAGLALASAILRFVLWRFYAPIEYSDTAAYLRLAEVLSRGTLDGYDGTRVPGYPAFLALFGRDPSQVWAAQLALGWGLGLLLFLFTWWTTRNATLSAVVGGLYSVIPGQFLFESNLLTESLTAAGFFSVQIASHKFLR